MGCHKPALARDNAVARRLASYPSSFHNRYTMELMCVWSMLPADVHNRTLAASPYVPFERGSVLCWAASNVNVTPARLLDWALCMLARRRTVRQAGGAAIERQRRKCRSWET